MQTPATDAALATLSNYQLLVIRMSSAVFATEMIVQAYDCLQRGQTAPAAGLVGRALDAAARRPFKNHAALWTAALDELVTLTGAVRSPSVIEIHVCSAGARHELHEPER